MMEKLDVSNGIPFTGDTEFLYAYIHDLKHTLPPPQIDWGNVNN